MKKTLLLLAATSMLIGCSATRIAYDNFGLLSRFMLGRYVDLDTAQADALKPRIAGFHQWHRANEMPVYAAVLKSASAYEAYQKRRHAGLDPRTIAEFLLLDPDFPRSVRHAAKNLLEALEQIGKSRPEANPALLREASWLYARLQHADVDDILTRDESGLELLLNEFNTLGRAIHEAYFVV